MTPLLRFALVTVRAAIAACCLVGPAHVTQAQAAERLEPCGAKVIEAPANPRSAGDDMQFERAARSGLVKAYNDSRLHADLPARLAADAREAATATAHVVRLLGLDQPPDPLHPPVNIGANAGSAREDLARMAIATDDPVVYAIAFKACVGRTGEGSCRQVTAARWSQLDPGNAAPWLLRLGDDAADGADPASIDQALHRIGRSERSSMARFATTAEVLRVSPADDASLLEIDRVVTGLLGHESAVLAPYERIVAACKGRVLLDANRWQVCDGVARLFTERSDTLVEQIVGAGMGDRLGWDEARLARLRAEPTAFAAVQGEFHGNGRLDCTAVRQRVDAARALGTAGEVGVVRAALARAGAKP